MSRTIHILPETLANKIAAGEVVQRPASAVKELIENAIDAGTGSITVIIKDGGKSLIQVIDDGVGMSAEDAGTAFARHATSKIASYEDLENIRTLGFRGEALASIAAVGQVELRTRRREDEVGTKIRIDGGTLLEESKDAPAPGTSIQVRNLFYNTPGRRNFLKGDNTEFKHVYDVVHRVALSHPEIRLSFISDEENILQLRPSTFPERIKDVFGDKAAQSVLYFEEGDDVFKVSGCLGKPEYARKTKTEQYVFLNSRYILSRNLSHAVFKAYEQLLEKGSFPFYILFLQIDPRKVDVNVHPSKMEVKFEDEGGVYRLVYSAVRQSLSAHDLVPTVAVRGSDRADDAVRPRFDERSIPMERRATDWRELIRPLDGSIESGKGNDPTVRKAESETREARISTGSGDIGSPGGRHAEIRSGIDRPEGESIPLWQVHRKYIFVPTREGMMVVDQHAAHERILYERAIARFEQDSSKSQQLLFPHTIEMTAGDATLVRDLQPLLEGLGFSIKLFGSSTVIVDGVPVDVKAGEEGTILQQVIDLFKEDQHDIQLEPRERLAKSFSCKAAIKSGDLLKEGEIRSLLDQLFRTEVPFVCPHGRPVVVNLSLSELDRRFGRTS